MRWCQAQSQSAGVKVTDVLTGAQPVGSQSHSDIQFSSACGRWNECEDNDLYFAVNEAELDGHDFVDEAIARGASGVVCERLLPINVPQFLVADSRIAYGQACQALAGQPSRRMQNIGVAGGVGKTVTSHLLHSIFEAAGLRTGLSSSIQFSSGEARGEQPRELNSPSIASGLAKMCIGKSTHSIVEMPSAGLARRVYSGIELDAAVITNIQSNELALHGNLANCQAANARILDLLKPTGFAVFNADDRNSASLLDGSDTPTLTFGIHQHAEVTAKIIERNSSFQTFVVSAGSESVVVRTSVIGKQHIYNCLAAAAVALTLDIELTVIAQGLENTRLPGRMERVDCGQEFGLWVDSASTPVQLAGAISAIAPVCDGKIWCICSTTENQNSDQRRRLGEILQRKIEQPIITQLTLESGVDYEPCHQVLDGFSKPEVARVMPERRKAIEWALANAGPDDAVLIVGAGENANILRGPGKARVSLTDREICQTYLCERGQQLDSIRQQIYRAEDYR